MPHKLKALKIDRVDLVDKGANQAAHVLLFKRDGVEKAKTLQEILDAKEKLEEAYEDRWKITNAFIESLESCSEIDDAEERLRIIMASASQYVRMMKPVKETLEEEDVYMTEEEIKKLQQEKDDAVKRAEEAEAELAKRDASTGEDDIWKGVPESVRKRFEEQQKETEVAKALAAAERDNRIKQEAIAKAAGYESLPVNPDDDWQVFKAIDAMDEGHAKRIYELFKAGDANLASTVVTKEKGTGGGDQASGRSTYDEIQRLVDETIQKSSGQVKYDDALNQVFRQHPDLYKRYTEEVMQNGR